VRENVHPILRKGKDQSRGGKKVFMPHPKRAGPWKDPEGENRLADVDWHDKIKRSKGGGQRREKGGTVRRAPVTPDVQKKNARPP